MARSKFRTRLGRPRHHQFRTRAAIHHHGFLTRYHRPVTGGRMTSGHHHRGATQPHVAVKRSVHAGQIIAKKTRAKSAKRSISAATKAKLSHSLTGKKHPHRGHAMSTAARAKIAASTSARLKGRPHPHKGHAMSNTARAKISKSLKGKPHPRRTASKKK